MPATLTLKTYGPGNASSSDYTSHADPLAALDAARAALVNLGADTLGALVTVAIVIDTHAAPSSS